MMEKLSIVLVLIIIFIMFAAIGYTDIGLGTVAVVVILETIGLIKGKKE